MGARFWSGVYLVFLAWPVLVHLETRPGGPEAAVVLAGALAFAGLYLRVVWTALDSPRAGRRRGELALLMVLGAALAVPLREPWLLVSMFFVVTALVTSLASRAAVAGVGVVVVLQVVHALLSRAPASELWWLPLQTVLFAGAVSGYLRSQRAQENLLRSRALGERLAVENERLRFSRDLHDVLGHSLSVMAIKSELARRLVPTSPGRAATQMQEVEELSRSALVQMRQAVTGYRRLSLEDAVDQAREALGAAGVVAEVEVHDVPARAGEVLAWVVREGVTNVVRHSGATRCRLACGTGRDHAYAEVRDDGRPDPRARPGTGLLGLAERVEAAGGRLTSGGAGGGGFRLRATLPLT
ncbi:sensor histidine kinase [Thalassiella azotivora]